MAKFVLKPEKPKTIKDLQRYNAIAIYLKFKDNLKFEVGDFLVREFNIEGNWQQEKVSGASLIPKRFICTHEDEFGIKYVRAFSSTKSEVLPYISALTDLVANSRYVLDPHYVEHLILGDKESYDPSLDFNDEKRARNRITNLNKKIAVRNINIQYLKAKLEALNVGDPIWIGRNIPEAAQHKCTVIKYEKCFELDKWSGTGDVLHVSRLHVGSTTSSYDTQIGEWELMNSVFFFTEPYSYETL